MKVDPEAKTRLTETKPDAFVGRTVDGYRIDGVLGAGGMGTVYRATQLSLGRSVALKLLPESLAQDAQFQTRFQREADILSKLSHPSIVTVFDRGDVDGRPYLTMELVEGTSLREVLRKGSLPQAEALVIVRAILSALEHAHGQGIVHRDIKPENVLLAPGGIVKVADFGLSRLVADDDVTRLTRTHIALGTYEYMAPEQRERSREADERSDLYATGVVLYEMIAGELPIGAFPPLSRQRGECDKRIDEIIERSLAKDPRHRYQEATQMADAVSAVLEKADYRSARELPTVAEHVDFDPLKFAGRLDILATATTVIAVLLCLGGVIWVLAATVGDAFDYRNNFRSGTQWSSVRYDSITTIAPALAFFMFGWFAFEVAAGLRRFRSGARVGQGILAFMFAPIIIYSYYSWLWLHTFSARIYYEGRARGLDAQQAVSSIADVAYRFPDSPLTGWPDEKRTRRSIDWAGVLGALLGAAALMGAWVLVIYFFYPDRSVMRAESALAVLGALAIGWTVAVMPRLFRFGTRGPVYAFVGCAVFTLLLAIGTGAVCEGLRDLAYGR